MRTKVWLAIAAFVAALAADLGRATADQISAQVAVAGIHVYQATLSRLFAVSGVTCRFSLSCSHYGEAVIARFGLVRGGWMAMQRVVRCGPWTPAGTADPPLTAG